MDIDNHRVIVQAQKAFTGTAPNGETSLIEVTVQARVLPHGENELIAHYLMKQVLREALEKVDRIGLDRAKVAL